MQIFSLIVRSRDLCTKFDCSLFSCYTILASLRVANCFYLIFFANSAPKEVQRCTIFLVFCEDLSDYACMNMLMDSYRPKVLEMIIFIIFSCFIYIFRVLRFSSDDKINGCVHNNGLPHSWSFNTFPILLFSKSFCAMTPTFDSTPQSFGD